MFIPDPCLSRLFGRGSVYEINPNKQIAFICVYLCLSCLRGAGAVYDACGAGGGRRRGHDLRYFLLDFVAETDFWRNFLEIDCQGDEFTRGLVGP